MKPVLVIAIAVLLSALTSVAVVRLSPPPVAHEVGAPPATAEDLARLAQSIADVQARWASLAKNVEDLRADIASQPREAARVPVGEIEAAVARAMKEHAASTALESDGAGSKASGPKAFDGRRALAELTSADMTWDEAQKKWKEIDAAGGLDLVLALFERNAKDHPEDAQAQVLLGEAYLQKVFRSGNGPETGMWATKADKAFDAALGIDDRDWEARFHKAVSLSFWPPVFGKSGEAIKHFEILTEQQSSLPSQPQFAQTWLLLGNMYQQIGEKAKALSAWQKGLALFPDDAPLQQQIGNAQGH